MQAALAEASIHPDGAPASDCGGALSTQKSIREQALAAHSSGICARAVVRWARIFMARPAANSSDPANLKAPPPAFQMTVEVI
jgi:hypothetical protein